MELPVAFPFQKPLADKPNPKQGVGKLFLLQRNATLETAFGYVNFQKLNSLKMFSGLLAWSKDSQYICTRNDSMPTALWIWDMQRLEVAAILVQKEPIRAAVWDPTCTRLLLCTGSSHLYMWTPSGAFCVCNPLPGFSITDLKWNIDGSCLLLKDKDAFCCATVPPLPESSDYSSEASDD